MNPSEQIFSYGTLLIPEVQQRIIGRFVSGVPDALPGFSKSTIKVDGKTYPIISEGEGTIEGKILSVTSEELAKIDVYESAYKRAKVVLLSGKEAWVYQSKDN